MANKKGANLLIYPGSFNQTTGPLHWELLLRGRAIDTYRRNLQRAHVERLAKLMKSEDVNGRRGRVTVKQSDIIPILRGELNRIQRMAQNAIGSAPNTISRYHLQDIVERIDEVLNP